MRAYTMIKKLSKMSNNVEIIDQKTGIILRGNNEKVIDEIKELRRLRGNANIDFEFLKESIPVNEVMVEKFTDAFVNASKEIYTQVTVNLVGEWLTRYKRGEK